MSRPFCLHADACRARNPGKHCRPCGATAVAKRPELNAKKRATMRAKFDDPAYRDRHAANSSVAIAKRLQTPEGRAQHQRFMAIGEVNLTNPKLRQMAADAQFLKHNPWCPIEMRPLNKRLRKLGFSEAERRKIILTDVPGTPEHARRSVSNVGIAMRIRHQREQAQAY